MEFKDYYSALDVAKTASDDEIRKSFRKLARKYHPDVSKEANAEARMRDLNEAYEVLRDKDKRAAYDALAERAASGRPHGQATAGAQDFQPPPGWDEGYTFHRSGGPSDETDFSDFFSSLFGEAQRRQAQSQQASARGEDQHAAIEIDIETAFRGGERRMELRALELDAQGHPRWVQRTLDVRIPPGVRPGQFIRLAGQGLPGHGGQPAGDLYLDVRIAPDPVWRVDGVDLYMTLPVTPTEAALGAELPLALPNGDVVEVSVPAGSRNGRKLRLRDRGFPGKTPGHLYLLLEIALPPADSDAARAAYEALAKASTGFDPRRHLSRSGA